MKYFTHRWPQSGRFFPRSRNSFPVFEKEQRGPSSSLQLRACSNEKCRIPLLTKFTAMKLKTHVWSSLLEVVICFFHRALFIQSSMKLRADAYCVYLIFFSINQQLLSFSALYNGLRGKCKTPGQTKFRKLEMKIDAFSVSVSLNVSAF